MTKAETVKAVRALGLSCVWRSEWREFRVNFRREDTRFHGDDSAYYSDDAEDVIGAARAMAAVKTA